MPLVNVRPSTFTTVAKTPAAGAAFTNGTPNFLSWTAPNDGQLHSVQIIGYIGIIVANTGGAAQVISTINGVGQTTDVDSGGAQGGGTYNQISVRVVCDPGSTVTLQQSSALTAGQKTMWASILAQ